MGRQNAIRNPDRSAATASALMIGLGLATFVTVLGASTKAYIEAQLDRYQVDFELRTDQQPNGEGKSAPPPMSPDLVRRLTALPQLDAVVPVTGTGEATVGGERAGVEAVDPAGLARVLDVDVRQGSLAALSAGGIGVSADAAAARGWEHRLARTGETDRRHPHPHGPGGVRRQRRQLRPLHTAEVSGDARRVRSTRR